MTNWDKLASDLVSWYWWLTVVALGLAINLLSSYLKPTVDRWYSRASELRRAKLEQSDIEFNAEVAVATEDDAYLLAKGFEELRWRHSQIFFFVGAGFFVGFGLYARQSTAHPTIAFWVAQLFFITAIVLIVLSAQCGSRAARNGQILYKATSLRLKKPHPTSE